MLKIRTATIVQDCLDLYDSARTSSNCQYWAIWVAFFSGDYFLSWPFMEFRDAKCPSRSKQADLHEPFPYCV